MHKAIRAGRSNTCLSEMGQFVQNLWLLQKLVNVPIYRENTALFIGCISSQRNAKMCGRLLSHDDLILNKHSLPLTLNFLQDQMGNK